jgi:hypothetical protein
MTRHAVLLLVPPRSFCTAVSVEDGCVMWSRAKPWLEALLRSGRIQRLQGYLAINTEVPQPYVILRVTPVARGS